MRVKNYNSAGVFIRNTVLNFHNFNIDLNDEEIDEILRLRPTIENFSFAYLAKQHGDEQFTYEGTPYSCIREMLHDLLPSKKDVVYDLGSGYGRFVIYGGLVSEALFKGIEIVPDRISTAKKVIKFLGLANVDLILGNAVDQDFEEGNIFFLFNPFLFKTLELVGKKLEIIAREKPIKIATWGGPSNLYFSDQPWLSEEKIYQLRRVQLFKSNYV